MTQAQPSTTLVDRLRRDEPMLVLTGAGVSAESGLATFRGPDGLWAGRAPTELATPQAFATDPAAVWRFYAWRRSQAAAAVPNAAHRALVDLDRSKREFLLVTQNVDGLHERCGQDRILRLHGSLWRLRCVGDGSEREDRRVDLDELPPRCDCGALLRPAVVWFGEPLPEEVFAAAEHAARHASLMLVVGTSSVVYPAALLPRIARSAGAWVVEINPEPTPLSPEVDERFDCAAGSILPTLVHLANGLAGSPA